MLWYTVYPFVSSKLRFSILSLTRLVVVAAGFHRVRMRGKQHIPSDPREAPVVVMAPHSSFFDAIAIVCLGAPSIVAKADTARLPFIGRRSWKFRMGRTVESVVDKDARPPKG